MSAVPLALIASVDRQRIIGSDNELVWREPEDQRWFRRQTMGCPVVMGRKTWDSLPVRFRPLPGRVNIVVTRQGDWQSDGAQVAHTLADALAQARASAAATGAPRVFVIGGGQLFAEALPLADQLLMTEIDADLPGDVRFPDWRDGAFVEQSRDTRHSDGPPACAYAFVTYQRHR
ncbi:MAG TPA: dihydrofolate reductase [Aquabacterium sp.]|nr:dihydrofolate reductase [Aquabacterium sp.]HQC97806.1 dihydrofolate reductase [Aquabacterium sp.]